MLLRFPVLTLTQGPCLQVSVSLRRNAARNETGIWFRFVAGVSSYFAKQKLLLNIAKRLCKWISTEHVI